jgi:hypothetical protein
MIVIDYVAVLLCYQNVGIFRDNWGCWVFVRIIGRRCIPMDSHLISQLRSLNTRVVILLNLEVSVIS